MLVADGMNPEDFLSELESFKDEFGLEKPDLTSEDAASIGGVGASDFEAIFAEPGPGPNQQPPPATEPPDRGRRRTQAAAVASTADGRRSNDKRRIATTGTGGAAAQTARESRPGDDRGSIIKLLVAAVLTVLVLSWIATSCLGDDSDSVETTGGTTTTVADNSTTSAPTTTAATTTQPAPTPDLAADAAAALTAAGIDVQGLLVLNDGSTITLAGIVDSEETKAAAEAAVAALDRVETVDNQLIVEAAPDLGAEANQALIDAGIPGVSATVEGDVATLTGEAANGELRLVAELAVVSISGINSVDNQISVPPTPAEILTTTLNDLVTANPILFSTGSADIRDSSKPTLDEVAATIIANPSGAVEVGGHTDSDGGADANRELSQERAQSVLDYLVSKGVDGARLSAVGYGEDSPLVPNSSGDNKRKNRRIEFTVS